MKEKHQMPAAEATVPSSERRSRRALLSAAGGAAAGVLAAMARPASALGAAGDSLTLGQVNDSGTSQTILNNAGLGAAFTLKTTNQSTGATGIFGWSSGGGAYATRGVYGRGDGPNSYGVYGRNAGAAGTGAAVYADGGNNDGVVANTANPDAAAVRASSTSTAASAVAILGESAGSNGAAVHGVATGTVGSGQIPTGVRGFASRGDGVWGYAQYAGDGGEAYYGVLGESEGESGAGVYGAAYNPAGINVGVYALTYGSAGRALYAEANSDGVNYGVYANTTSASGYGLWSQGNAHVQGDATVSNDLTVSGVKSFRIDHPLDPANRFLTHFCTESSEVLNLYSGNAQCDGQGEATVTLPAWFEEVNRDVRYQLTPIGASAPLFVKTKLNAGQFAIAGGQPGMQVSWQLTAIRSDRYVRAHAPTAESAKRATERGRYLHPDLYGEPADRAIAWEHRPQDATPSRRHPR